jgi:hypothetical protein
MYVLYLGNYSVCACEGRQDDWYAWYSCRGFLYVEEDGCGGVAGWSVWLLLFPKIYDASDAPAPTPTGPRNLSCCATLQKQGSIQSDQRSQSIILCYPETLSPVEPKRNE